MRATPRSRSSREPRKRTSSARRRGWAGRSSPWYTLTDDFDKDFGVDEWHGTNAFLRDDDGRIFRTYLVNGRGDEALGGLWAYLDLTALGRQEEEDSPCGLPADAAPRVVQAPRRVRRARRTGSGRLAVIHPLISVCLVDPSWLQNHGIADRHPPGTNRRSVHAWACLGGWR